MSIIVVEKSVGLQENNILYNNVHFHVFVVDGDCRKLLEREAHTYFICIGDKSEEPVVVAFATSEAVAVGIKGYTGNHYDINRLIIGEAESLPAP